MLVFAAIGVFGAGMLAIAAGIPIKDFGYGNTLILSGVMAWCTSAVMLTLWACFRDLKQGIFQPGVRPAEPAAPAVEPRPVAVPPPAPAPATPPGWPETIPERAAAPPAPPPPPEVREPRRNLLFASNRRPPRDNSASSSAAETPISQAPAASPLDLRPTSAIEEPRPAPRRIESPPPRPVRPISTVGPRDPVSAPPLPPAPPPASVEPPPPRDPERSAPAPSPAPPRSDASVTVLKSGVVDGMAYWLYSDGSIEAQMPEGMMRFTSIDELRAHLDKRT